MRHQDTVIYARILELMRLVSGLIGELPAGWSFLADQMRRSTTAIGLNFAEGYYQPSTKQLQRYFIYAIQSARETSMALDASGAFELADSKEVERGKDLCLQIVKMMSKLGKLGRPG